ncbi:hypothetical protein H1C71_015089 [Ictidomys tridecemlineatus]|nr:hypothetical protein H1C71_015089 [Ictidomys tridecemlineatus]
MSLGRAGLLYRSGFKRPSLSPPVCQACQSRPLRDSILSHPQVPCHATLEPGGQLPPAQTGSRDLSPPAPGDCLPSSHMRPLARRPGSQWERALEAGDHA